MKELTLLLLVGFFATTTGCGADDGADASPAERCESYLDALCTKHASCWPPTDRARVREDCIFALALDVDCKSVTGVGGSYLHCMFDIPQAKCMEKGGITTPSSCAGILITGGI